MATVAADPPGPGGAAMSGGRRRRPSGEPPPLPRPVAASTRWYLGALLVTTVLEGCLAVHPLRRWITAADGWLLAGLARLRGDWSTPAFRALENLGSADSVRVLAWTTIAILVLARRFRHLLTYLAVLLVVVTGTSALAQWSGRMRPAAVAIVGPWHGYSHPAGPVTVLAAVSVGAVNTLIPSGAWRNRATALAAAAVGALAASRLVLGADHPSDTLAALGIGWALSVVAYRWITPDEVFAVRYRRGNAAHLDVTGRRGEAIRRALDQQLGIRAESVEPFGQAGSAGSTPLRIGIRHPDGRPGTLFAKLYALNHLRADRSYKLARMVRYGRLEDEKPFSTVRRLAEYEDHLLRLLRDARLPTPRPYGFVEITPEREYLVVMSFLEQAQELGSRPVTDTEIDGALRIVRQLWRAGVAHRDIKPSNVLLAGGRVWLIDVAFATVRPTPWRQAVDLANMMLTLALVGEPERIYHRALALFTPDDVAEAFAASRGVTVPSQLRGRLRRHGRDLMAEFRRLAPDRPPVAIQLWSLRRVAVTTGMLVAVLAGLAGIYAYTQVAGLL